MKIKNFFTTDSNGQSVIEFIMIIGAIVSASIITFSVYSRTTHSGGYKMMSSTNMITDMITDGIQLGGVEFIDIEKEVVKKLNAAYNGNELAQEECVKVDVGGSAVSKFSIPYRQDVKIQRPVMQLRMRDFCDISIETVTLSVDDRVYWSFKKTFFDMIKNLIMRIINFGKLKNYNHGFYYQ